MELTLNLVWVCVAIAAILVQIVMQSRTTAQPAHHESNWRKIVAMGCALVILFFVISMTDDLHDQALLLEESKSSRLAPGMRLSTHSSPDRSISFEWAAFFSVARFSPPLTTAREIVDSCDLQFPLSLERETLRGRAPPAA